MEKNGFPLTEFTQSYITNYVLIECSLKIHSQLGVDMVFMVFQCFGTAISVVDF